MNELDGKIWERWTCPRMLKRGSFKGNDILDICSMIIQSAYVRVCVCVCAWVNVFVCVCVCMCADVCACVCVCGCASLWASACACVCMCLCVHVFVCVWMDVCACVWMSMRVWLQVNVGKLRANLGFAFLLLSQRKVSPYPAPFS